MEKCGNDSAHAGESNASINGPVGLLRTQPPSVLSIHPHHIGFSQKLRTHTHMGSVFRSTSTHAGKSTEIQKNVEKCAFDSAHRVGPGSVEFQFWVFFSLSTPTCIPPTVMCPHHCPSRLCSIIGNFAKMNKNRKKYGKMWERLGACRGVECNLYQPDWPPSHQSTLHSFHPSPPHWIFRKLRTNTHEGAFFCQNRSMLENQQKFRKMWKNVHSTRRTGLARVVSIFHFGCLFRFPHPNTRPTRHPLHTVWVGIRWILQK